MQNMDDFLQSMTFDFFGSGKHKIAADQFFALDDALFLDVRSREELASLRFALQHHMPTLQIPIDEIPARLHEIPKEPLIGIFCSSSIRTSMVYAYLRIHDYQNVRILEGGYDAITAELKPGKLHKRLVTAL